VQVSSFDIINVYIITLRNSLKKSFHRDFHLIYNIIEIHTYKYLEGSVSF
jgi:hypothetical protein